MKKSDAFGVVEWSVECPYCEGTLGNFAEPPSEGEIIKCNYCKNKFISGGWNV